MTPWTVAHMGFSRQKYWRGLPFPSPGDLPDPGIEPRSPTLQADVLTSEPPGKPQRDFRTEHFLQAPIKKVSQIYKTNDQRILPCGFNSTVFFKKCLWLYIFYLCKFPPFYWDIIDMYHCIVCKVYSIMVWLMYIANLFCFFTDIYWSMVDLQCCISSRYTANWISYTQNHSL